MLKKGKGPPWDYYLQTLKVLHSWFSLDHILQLNTNDWLLKTDKIPGLSDTILKWSFHNDKKIDFKISFIHKDNL